MLVWLGSLVAVAGPSQGPWVVALEPTVGLEASLATRRVAVAEQQRAVLSAIPTGSIRVIRRYKVLFGMVVEANGSSLEALRAHPEVRGVGTDQVSGRGALDVSVPYIGGSLTDVVGFDGAGQLVAVLDSGIDLNHPALAGRVVDEYCECLDFEDNGCCPGGLAFSDAPGTGQDIHGHGTHVTGILASNGVIGSRGVAPEASLLAVKVLDDQNTFSRASQVTAGLEWVVLNHPDTSVLNMSLGTLQRFPEACDNTFPYTQLMAEAVDLLVAGGTVVVASTGNASDTEEVEAPACLSGVISVGNVHMLASTLPSRETACGAIVAPDDVVCSSNGGPLVDIVAPGFAIESLGIGGGLTVFGGTSMASPHVAGAAVVLRDADPTVTVSDIRDALLSSGTTITDDRNGLSHPRLDLGAAVDALINEDCTNMSDDDADGAVDCDDLECATDSSCFPHPTGTTGMTGDTGPLIEDTGREPEATPAPPPVDCDGCSSSGRFSTGALLLLAFVLRRRRHA